MTQFCDPDLIGMAVPTIQETAYFGYGISLTALQAEEVSRTGCTTLETRTMKDPIKKLTWNVYPGATHVCFMQTVQIPLLADLHRGVTELSARVVEWVRGGEFIAWTEQQGVLALWLKEKSPIEPISTGVVTAIFLLVGIIIVAIATVRIMDNVTEQQVLVTRQDLAAKAKDANEVGTLSNEDYAAVLKALAVNFPANGGNGGADWAGMLTSMLPIILMLSVISMVPKGRD